MAHHHAHPPSTIVGVCLPLPLPAPSSSTSPPPQSPPLAAAAAAAAGAASPALAQNTITLAQPAITNPRRLPPPCWSHDETVALIDAYRDKWYSLRRGNLKANHWQEVADAVSSCCPSASPAKTAVQCRHKMEKLRKRYRTELQRARSIPVSRFISSWVHFKRMDSMEKGHAALNPASATVAKAEKPDSDDDNFNDEDEDEDDSEFLGSAQFDHKFKNNGAAANSRNIHGLYHNGIGTEPAGGSKSGSGFRIKIPTGVSIAQPGVNYRKFDKKFNMGPAASDVNPNFSPNFGPNFGGGSASGGYGARVTREMSGMGKRARVKDPLEEMVGAIKVLGDGFVRMEQMKMEMAREIESMRMEMEMKRTEMILESQQRIVEAFAKAVAERKKKAKRMPTPEA
ncbi:trihelix transcription factor ASIL2 [Syzygium oleosum]|uniref:trihelix transcription factor ASIL2 n=1 Tax=Syzygium oleosum TaxID=219896 RepID=UPI0024BAD03D|nr:trihelix transcription factor ASIL2 [Syzygium oleosum]